MVSCGSFSMESSSLFLLLLFFNIPTAWSAEPICGLSVTSNQYKEILTGAPNCLYDGCKYSDLTNLSQFCDVDAPCLAIWKALGDNLSENRDWCRHCGGDRVCRVPQSPVLDLASACNASLPSLFTPAASGGCCASATETKNLTSWVNDVCNWSWKARFKDYDQMAQPDWNRYKFRLNYNVRPQNTSNISVPTPPCPTWKQYFWLFLAESMVHLFSSVFSHPLASG
jgi:hypothetical protein